MSLPVWMLSNWFMFATFLFALAGRIAISFLGHNWDMESYQLVVDLMTEGKNVYHETCRYNYSPIWMCILLGLKVVSGAYFRTAVAVFVSLVDVAIAAVLIKRGNRAAAILYLWSPMSMIISGYHNQFDNLALLIALWALTYAESRPTYNTDRTDWGLSMRQIAVMAMFIGLSLCAKHLLIFFVVWLMVAKQLSWRSKALLAVIPLAMFFGSFIPYLPLGASGIVGNVFFYSPSMNAPTYYIFLGNPVLSFLTHTDRIFQKLFFILIASAGLLMRKKPLPDMLMYYLLLLVFFASTVSPQYLIIPLLPMAMYRNRFWVIYNIIGGAMFVFHNDLLHVPVPVGGSIEDVCIYLRQDGNFPMMLILLLAIIDISRPQLMRWRTFVAFVQRYV